MILPRAETPIAHKDRCRFYTFDLLSERRLPRTSRHDFVFIEPWFDAFLDQLLRDLANGWLVLAVVAQEDIKDLGLGVLPVHAIAVFNANPVLYVRNIISKAIPTKIPSRIYNTNGVTLVSATLRISEEAS